MATFYAFYPPSGGGAGSSGGNPAAGPTGAPVPADADYIGFNVGGDLVGVSAATPLPVTIESGVGDLNVNIAEYGGVATTLGQKVSASSMPVVIASDQSPVTVSGTVTADQGGVWNITNITGTVSLPTGASTAANQSTEITALGTINTTLGSPFQAGGSIGNTTFASTQGTSPWIVAGGGTAGTPATGVVTIQGIAGGTAVPISGSITANNASVAPVPGAPPADATYVGGLATTAAPTYTTGDLEPLSLNLAGGLRVDGSGVTQPISAASLPLPTGASTSALQSGVQSSPGTPQTTAVTIQGNASGVPVPVSGTISSSTNTNGSVSNSTTVGSGSATTFSPPTNAVGFVIEAESSNTVNLRYAAGTTATTTIGMLLEPGRDSGYIPTAATVTIIATSGSGQACGIQWVLSS